MDALLVSESSSVLASSVVASVAFSSASVVYKEQENMIGVDFLKVKSMTFVETQGRIYYASTIGTSQGGRRKWFCCSTSMAYLKTPHSVRASSL